MEELEKCQSFIVGDFLCRRPRLPGDFLGDKQAGASCNVQLSVTVNVHSCANTTQTENNTITHLYTYKLQNYILRKMKAPKKLLSANNGMLRHIAWNLVVELFCEYIGRSYIALTRQDQYIGNILDPLGRLRSWIFWYLLQCCICICNTSIAL